MKRILMAVMVCLGLSGLPLASWAQGKISQAPLKKVSGVPSKFGYLEAPIDMSHLKPPITLMGHPSSWDWRDHAGVTPVKNQNPGGTCWAFASTGNIESRLLLDETVTYDLAEMEIVQCNHTGRSCNSGGNDWHASFYYSLHGMAQESCNPYVSCSSGACADCPWIKQLTEWQIVNDSADDEAIKEALYNIGPVSTSICASDTTAPTFSSYDGSYVIYNPENPGNDHAVLIVGYDDNMAHAGGQGAWIVKNSWGTSWGDNGYFYIAYGSLGIGRTSSVYSGYRNAVPGMIALTYEDDVPMNSLGYEDGHDWGAVLFTPPMTGNLTHVGFHALATDTSYTIKIFDNWNNGSPTTQLNITQSGTLTRAGYYTLELTSPVPVTNADEIVIMIEITTPGYNWPLSLDTTSPFETSKSFISDTGANGSWTAVDNGGSTAYGDFTFRAYITPPTCTYHQKLGADLRVTSNASRSGFPSLAWTGSQFGVSWMDDRNGNDEIYFARVSAAGAKLGADLRVTSAPGNRGNASLAWTGSQFGVSWMDNRDGNLDIYFARVSAAGAKLGADLQVTSDANESLYPSLAWTGSEFGVSWQDNRNGNGEIYFARVSAAGAKLGADLRVTSNANESLYPCPGLDRVRVRRELAG